MARMRVHELAKELNMNNKDLIDRILKLGVQVKNHMSTLTESTVEKIRDQFSEGKGQTVEKRKVVTGTGDRVVVRRRKKGEPEKVRLPEPPVEGGEALPTLEPHSAPDQVGQTPPPRAQPPSEPSPPEEYKKEPESKPLEAESEAPITDKTTPDKTVEQSPVETDDVSLEEPEALPPGALDSTSPAGEPERERVETSREYRPGESHLPEAQAPSDAQPEDTLEDIHRGLGPEKVKTEPLPSEPTEEPEDEDRKKTKKRRRKKIKKDEPAKIIKLAPIIQEEPEEEVEADAVSARFKDTGELETKDISRKKRIKAEEPLRETPDRKRQKHRKEVFEKKDLYSKKELAAQADRGRTKEREPLQEPGKPEIAPARTTKRRLRIDEAISVANLARQMGVKAGEVIKKLLLLGVPANINQALDFETAALIAAEFDFEVEKSGFEEEDILQTQVDQEEDLQPRPPVITVMGHVDHGKTSLLDAIRHTNVIEGEAGGITQHIGAYYVKLEHGDVVFLDTPGHEAFTSMRARGAKVTDIVILLVAADDGVMPQTVEAINHAKAANVPIIVAINKIDKATANVERVRRQLADHGLISEAWGGSTTMVEISAKQGMGIDELLEMVLLQAELMELRANPQKPARGRVVESKLDKGRGPVATILIQEGTLHAGDIYVCGTNSGRVRNMFNDRGQRLEEASPSMPVEVLGFSGVPNAGDQFIVLSDEKQAKLVAEHRQVKLREKELVRSSKVTLESLFDQIQEGKIKELNLIVKADVHGSLEAIMESLGKLPTSEVKVNMIHTGTGAITETDVLLASASSAIVIGFNVRADGKVMELAEQEDVDIRFYDVIYQLISDVQDAMVGMLESVYKEKTMGRIEVRQTFRVPKMGMIAGSYVLDGRVERGARIRLLRDQIVIYDGKISSLRRFKDDVKEVKAGFECGVGIENFNDLKVGDILEVYELEEVRPTMLASEQDKKRDA